MARVAVITQVKRELVGLSDVDLTVLDLALAHAISNWDTPSARLPQGPFASELQYNTAKYMHDLVLRIKKGAIPADPFEDDEEDEDG